MAGKQTLIHVSIVLLLVTSAVCGLRAERTPDIPANVPEDRIASAAQIEADKDVAAEIMPILEALFRG